MTLRSQNGEVMRQENDAHYEHRRLRNRQNSLEYDPDNDDYQMIVKPCSSKLIEYEEKRLIQKQIHQLFHRIQRGGTSMCCPRPRPRLEDP